MHFQPSAEYVLARARCSEEECGALLELHGVHPPYYRIENKGSEFTEFRCSTAIVRCLRQLDERIDFVESERARITPITNLCQELDFALLREDLAMKIIAQRACQPSVLTRYARTLYLCCVDYASQSEIRDLEARTADEWLDWLYRDFSDVSTDDRVKVMRHLLKLWDRTLSEYNDYHWLAYGQFHTPLCQSSTPCLQWLGISGVESKQYRTANDLIKRCAFMYSGSKLHIHRWEADDIDGLVSLASAATLVPVDTCAEIFKQIHTLHSKSSIFHKPQDTLLLFITHPLFRQSQLQIFVQTKPGLRIFKVALHRVESSEDLGEITLSLLTLWTFYQDAADLSSMPSELSSLCSLTQFRDILKHKPFPSQGSSTQARVLMIMIRDLLDAMRTHESACEITREYILGVVRPDLQVDIVDSFNHKYWSLRLLEGYDSTKSYFMTITEGYNLVVRTRDEVEMYLWQSVYRHLRNYCFCVVRRIFSQTAKLNDSWEV